MRRAAPWISTTQRKFENLNDGMQGVNGPFFATNSSLRAREACRFQNSCNVEDACVTLGNGARIGHDSCNGGDACIEVGLDGSSVIGTKSCNGRYACKFAGIFDPKSPSVIGNHYCDEAANLSDPDNPVGICDGNVGTIGNNRINAP